MSLKVESSVLFKHRVISNYVNVISGTTFQKTSITRAFLKWKGAYFIKTNTFAWMYLKRVWNAKICGCSQLLQQYLFFCAMHGLQEPLP